MIIPVADVEFNGVPVQIAAKIASVRSRTGSRTRTRSRSRILATGTAPRRRNGSAQAVLGGKKAGLLLRLPLGGLRHGPLPLRATPAPDWIPGLHAEVPLLGVLADPGRHGPHRAGPLPAQARHPGAGGLVAGPRRASRPPGPRALEPHGRRPGGRGALGNRSGEEDLRSRAAGPGALPALQSPERRRGPLL